MHENEPANLLSLSKASYIKKYNLALNSNKECSKFADPSFSWLSQLRFERLFVSSFKFIYYIYKLLFFSKLARGRNPSNPAIWLVPRAGGILRSCPLLNPGGIVGSFIHKFVCCLWMSKNHDFWTISFFKLALSLALAMEKGILFFKQKMWRKNQASLATLSLLAGSPNFGVHPYR